MVTNFKKLIDELKKPEWHYQEMTGCLHLASVCNRGAGKTFHTIILIAQNDKVVWTYSRKQLSQLAAKIVNKELNKPGSFKKLFNSSRLILKKYKTLCSLIEKTDFKKLNDK
jgi:hypothetical protein